MWASAMIKYCNSVKPIRGMARCQRQWNAESISSLKAHKKPVHECSGVGPRMPQMLERASEISELPRNWRPKTLGSNFVRGKRRSFKGGDRGIVSPYTHLSLPTAFRATTVTFSWLMRRTTGVEFER